jgi:hypothetical protein
MNHCSRTCVRNRSSYVTTVQDEECWPCINECDFTGTTKQRPNMTDDRRKGWSNFQVSAAWLSNQWFGWRSTWRVTDHV